MTGNSNSDDRGMQGGSDRHSLYWASKASLFWNSDDSEVQETAGMGLDSLLFHNNNDSEMQYKPSVEGDLLGCHI